MADQNTQNTTAPTELPPTQNQPAPAPAPTNSTDGGTQAILDAAGLSNQSTQNTNAASALGTRVIASTKNSADQLDPLTAVAQASFEKSNAAVSDLRDTVTQQVNTINDAINKKQDLATMPLHQVIGPLAELFGMPDYSIDAQNRRIQDASRTIEAANQKANVVLEASKVAQGAAAYSRENALTGLQASREIATTQNANVSTQIQLQAAQHAQKLQFLESLTPPQLKALAADPTTMAAKGVGAGDIADVVTRKNEAQIHLNTAGVLLDSAQTNNSREHLELGAIAAEKGLSLMTGQQLADLRAQAANAPDGRVMVDSGIKGANGKPVMFPVSTQTIDQKILERDDRIKKYAESEVNINQQIASVPGKLQNTATTLPTLFSDPSVAQYLMKGETDQLKTNFSSAANLAQSPNLSDKATASVVLDGLQKQIADIVEKARASAPEGKRAGIIQLYSSGQMDSQSASDWLASEVQNSTPVLAHPNPLIKGDIGTKDPYAFLDLNLRNAMQSATLKQASIMGGGGKDGAINLADMTRFKQSPKDLFETRVMKDPVFQQAKADTDANLRNWYATEAVKRLATDQTVNGANRPGIDAFKQFYDGGHVAPKYQMPGQPDKLNIDMVTKMLHGQDKAAGTNNLSTFLGTLNDQGFQNDMALKDRQRYDSPLHAALRGRFYNNDISNVLVGTNGLLSRIRMSQMQADQQMQEQQAARELQMQGAQNAGRFGSVNNK